MTKEVNKESDNNNKWEVEEEEEILIKFFLNFLGDIHLEEDQDLVVKEEEKELSFLMGLGGKE